jgi:hypothetical protein
MGQRRDLGPFEATGRKKGLVERVQSCRLKRIGVVVDMAKIQLRVVASVKDVSLNEKMLKSRR